MIYKNNYLGNDSSFDFSFFVIRSVNFDLGFSTSLIVVAVTSEKEFWSISDCIAGQYGVVPAIYIFIISYFLEENFDQPSKIVVVCGSVVGSRMISSISPITKFSKFKAST